jgi:hypothetical protein
MTGIPEIKKSNQLSLTKNKKLLKNALNSPETKNIYHNIPLFLKQG